MTARRATLGMTVLRLGVCSCLASWSVYAGDGEPGGEGGGAPDGAVRQPDLALASEQLALDVSFASDDDGISAQAVAPLLKLGALVASLPGASVRVAGYADPRGSDEYNQELSLRRAQSVAAVLAAAGVPAERILIEGRGRSEAKAAAVQAQAFAAQRRVTVRVELPATDAQVARRE